MSGPPVRYADSSGVEIAYQVLGDGPLDLVWVAGTLTHLGVLWEHPGYRHFCEQLASFSRLILFDKRGMGLSERTRAGTLEERMDDVRAVMDAAGSERAALIGVSEGGPMSMLFAAGVRVLDGERRRALGQRLDRAALLSGRPRRRGPQTLVREASDSGDDPARRGRLHARRPRHRRT
jgi:pimeloyl-ACP methyl ester carboxylesterase